MLVNDSAADKFKRLFNEYIKKVSGEFEAVKVKEDSVKNTEIVETIEKFKVVRIIFPKDYREPSEIDVLLSDKEQGEEYAIYVMEIDDDSLGDIFEDLDKITTQYLSGNYKHVVKRGFLSRSEYIEFDDPEIIHRTAMRTKRPRQ